MKFVLLAMFVALVTRFGFLVWGGYRNGRIKSAALWSRYFERQTQPQIFWMYMVVHSFVVIVSAGCAVDLVLGLFPSSS